MDQRVLFICKRKIDSYGKSFGLVNSCKFIANLLNKFNIEAKVEMVVDGNGIDAVVHNYKPTHVFIEALWATPAKMQELMSLPKYSGIQWYVRIHSQIPFIANEGIAIQWLKEYWILKETFSNFHVCANAKSPVDDLYKAFGIKMLYLPNIYFPEPALKCPKNPKEKNTINVACFGAIRPMKNQLAQAIAVIIFGNELNKKIKFHINGNRLEQKGDPVIKNIRNAFLNTEHELVEHLWMPHNEFILIVKQMDLGLQVSFSETFNIVAADFVSNDIPLIGAPDIFWLNSLFKANPNSIPDIVKKTHLAYSGRKINLHYLNKLGLNNYNDGAIKIWLQEILGLDFGIEEE